MFGMQDRVQRRPKPGPEDRGTLSDSIYLSIRRSIRTLECLPGEALPELHIARAFGVSRTPVREALRRLQSERLVTLQPRFPARVAVVTREQAVEALQIRMLLEPYAAELAAVRISKTQLRAAARILDSTEAWLASRDGDSLSMADQLNLERRGQAFHDLVVEASACQTLISVIENDLWPSWFAAFYVLTPASLVRSLADHRRILQALAARGPAAAREAMDIHGKAMYRLVQPPAGVEQLPTKGEEVGCVLHAMYRIR